LIAGQSPATKAIARTFLPAAIHSLDCSLVSTLLDTGIDPNSCMDRSRQRSLQIAIAKQSMEITQLLLDRGADVSLRFSALSYSTDVADTPLKAAIQIGRLDLVQLLLQAQAHVNDHDSRHASSSLNLAARSGLLKIVQLLLDAGAEVNESPREFHQETALQTAARAGSIEIVQLLLSYGADINRRYISHWRRDPETALQCATSSGNLEITQLLLFHGVVDVVRALEFAGQSQCGRVLNYLVRSWMTSYAFLGYGFGGTALRAATDCGDFDLVRTLLHCGAPTDGDTKGHTSLQIAARHGDIRIAELLLS
jgi:ankyrin repeat protein